MDKIIAALGALIGVSIFSTGFLSVRLRTQLSDAANRLQHLEDRLRKQDSITKEEAELTLRKLEATANPDPVAKLPIRLNVAIAVAALLLATVAGLRSNWQFVINPYSIATDFLILVVLCVVEVVIVYIGIADVRRVRLESKFGTFNSAIYWLHTAEKRLHQAWFEQAHSDCRSGLDLAPRWPPLLTLMSRIHLAAYLTDLDKYKNRDKDEELRLAIKFAERATASEQNAESIYYRAEVYLRSGNLNEANVWYQKSVDAEFEVYASLHNLGSIDLIHGNSERAIERLNAALNSYQTYHSSSALNRFDYSQWNECLALQKLGRFNEAQKTLKIATENWKNAGRYHPPLRQPEIAGNVLFLFTPMSGVDVPKPKNLDHWVDPMHLYFDNQVDPPWVHLLEGKGGEVKLSNNGTV